RYQRHHPGRAILQLMLGALQKDAPSVEEDGGTEEGSDPDGSGENWRGEADQPGEHLSPDERRNGQRQGDPEAISKHLRTMAFMAVVPMPMAVTVPAMTAVTRRVVRGGMGPVVARRRMMRRCVVPLGIPRGGGMR